MIINSVKDFVEKECNRPTNVLSAAFYSQHILIVHEFACKLASVLGADMEVVEIASYLHDISAIQDIKTLGNHAVLSSEYSEELLLKLNYGQEKIMAVKKVILSHSKPLSLEGSSPEEVSISNADAISQIVNPAYWLYFAFNILKFDYKKGVEWYLNKVSSNLEQMTDMAKEMISEEVKSTIKILGKYS